MPTTVFEILADARNYGETLRGMVADGKKVEVSQDRISSAGIKTTRAFKRELLEIEKLTVALKDDALATKQLQERKERLTREMRRLSGETSDYRKEVKRSAKGTSTLAGGLKSLAFTAAAYLSLDLVKKIFELGTAVEETSNKFTTVFGDAAEAVDDFGRKFFNVAGLTRTEGRDITSTLGAIAQGMGVVGTAGEEFFDILFRSQKQLKRTGEASADFSILVTSLAGDIASFNNQRIDDVLRDIQSGLVGQVEPLRKYGIELDAVSVKQTALQITGKRLEKQLTNEDKILARLFVAYDRAGVQVGDLERTKNDLANVTRRVTARLREEAEEFSAALLPALGLIIDELDELIIKNTAAAKTFREVLRDALFDTAAGIISFITVVSSLIGALQDLEGAFVSIDRAFSGTGTIDESITEATSSWETFLRILEDLAAGVNVLALGFVTMAQKVKEADVAILSFFGATEAANRQQELVDDLQRQADRLVVSILEIGQQRRERNTSLAATVENLKRETASTTALRDLLNESRDLVKSQKTEKDKLLSTQIKLTKSVDEFSSAEERTLRSIRRGNEALKDRLAILREPIPAAGRLGSDFFLPGTVEAPEEDPLAIDPDDLVLRQLEATADGAIGQIDRIESRWQRFLIDFSDQGEALVSTGNLIFGQFASAAAAAFEGSGEKSKAFFTLWKAFAVAQAVINTYEAATGAYKALAGIPIVGPALGAAAAAAAILFGAAQVAKIKNTQPGDASVGGGGAAPAAAAPATAISNPAAGIASGPPAGVFSVPGVDDASRRMSDAADNLGDAVERLVEDGIEIFGTSEISGDNIVVSYDRRTKRLKRVGV